MGGGGGPRRGDAGHWAAVNTGTGGPSAVDAAPARRAGSTDTHAGRAVRAAGGVAQAVEERHRVVAGEQAEAGQRHGAGRGGDQLGAYAGQSPVHDEAEEGGAVGAAARPAIGGQDGVPVGASVVGGRLHAAGQQSRRRRGRRWRTPTPERVRRPPAGGRHGEGEERPALQGRAAAVRRRRRCRPGRRTFPRRRGPRRR